MQREESPVTASADTSTVEWVEIYFNMPADKSVAVNGNEANDKEDLLRTLIRLINSAKHSVDISIYNLENHEVGEALGRAANRGVRVRVVTDHYNRYRDRELGESMWMMLAEAGIYSIDDAGEIFMPDGSVDASHRLPGASYDMHNKFAIIDYMSKNPDDYYVWTGSMNLTYTGPYNSNNTIVIKDSGIAEAYYSEFIQMWGGDADIPNAKNARFHKDKEYIGNHIFYVDTTKVELYFAPINRSRTKPSVASRLHQLVNDYAQNDINFLAFAITPDIPMSQSLWQRSASEGILLNGVIDPRFYGRYRNTGAIWAAPEAQLGNRKILPARELRTLHHKYLLIDTANPGDRRGLVFTGSYNFSRNAEENNDENALIFHSHLIANQYYQDFMGAMNRAQEKTEPPIPRIVHEKWYPVMRIQDGSRFEIEVARRFGYPVRFLGVEVPRIYAGQDSSEYYSLEADQFLEHLLEDKEIRMYGYDLFTPESRYGSFRAYAQARDSQGDIIDVNKELLKNGFGEWTRFYRQHPDSIDAYKQYTEYARENNIGMWQNPERVGERIARVDPIGDDAVPVEYPININTANEQVLQALTGIGPTYAARIVEYRLETGGFTDIEQLENIQGIGPATMEKIRPFISVE